MDPRTMQDRAAMQNLFLYGGGAQQQQPPQQGNEGGGNVPAGDPQQQQQAGYNPGLFMQGYFSQSQQAAAAAHQAAAMAEARLSAQAYGGQEGGYDPRYAAAAGYGDQGGGAQQEYMDANRLLLQRLGQPNAQQWMMAGYGMPQGQGMEAYADSGMLAPWSTTSAGLLGKMGGEEKKKTVRKKHKDKPKRPLSAYNLFFKDERQNILKAIPSKEEGDDKKDDEEEDKEEEEEEEGDDKDEAGKKRKRKKPPHGKIGFENLAKIIGQRWQKLEPERVEHYKKLAAKDMKRYKEEMEVFLTKIENEKKAKQEEEEGGAPAPAAETEGGEEETGEPEAKKAKTEEEGKVEENEV